MRSSSFLGVAVVAIGVVCLSLALVGPEPSVLQQSPSRGAAGVAGKGEKAPSSFRHSWGAWLKGVEDQVEAAADVSRGLAQGKLAKLDGVLKGDLEADVQDEPEPAAAAHRKAASTTATEASTAHGGRMVAGGAQAKPFAKALTRDDKFIAKARQGVQRAEKALAMQEEMGVDAIKVAPFAAPHKAAAPQHPAAAATSTRHVARKATAAHVASKHQQHRALSAAAKQAKVKSAPVGARRAPKGDRKSQEKAKEDKMLSMAMQGALEAGLQDAKAGKEESREVKQEEGKWSSDLSKWGLS